MGRRHPQRLTPLARPVRLQSERPAAARLQENLMARQMGSTWAGRKGRASAWVAALAALLTGGPAAAHWPSAGITSLEVYDRNDGMVLPVYEKDGRRYVVGTPGHEYTLRIHNLTGGRILAVTSVDGINVVTGETAAPDQSGYVIDSWGSVDISGWRKSLERTAAFYFTDLGDSYAARAGHPGNVGVIGVAVFRERVRAVYAPPRERIAVAGKDASSSPSVPPPEAQAATPEREDMRDRVDQARSEAKTLASPLGTGHGRSETSYATRVTFERASVSPAQLVTIQYDRRDNLIALGVVPDTRYAQRAPRPFPGTPGFVPDPR
jgi:hypothetical protein